MKALNMSPRRPYLLRACYDWLLDNQCTPYILVDIEYPGVDVPREYASDGRIVLNISSTAVVNFVLNNQEMYFNARMRGVSYHMNIPIGAITAIYSKENGEGIFFEMEAHYKEVREKSIDKSLKDNDSSVLGKVSGTPLRLIK